MYKLEYYAKKTFLALKNPYKTVLNVYPNIIDNVKYNIDNFGYSYYMGIKNTNTISCDFINNFEKNGFLKHTIDKMSLGGRAIDLDLINPLTTKYMTGSSSGTALNVFYGINDLGIGTDGGGSVLAPASSLNLYGLISPIIDENNMKKYKKLSTDNIEFCPSIGFISRDLEIIKKAVNISLPMKNIKNIDRINIKYVDDDVNIYDDRKILIDYVNKTVKTNTILISKEGPVDIYGIGDSIYGHFDENTLKNQRLSNKGLMRVVNMCNKSALCIPQKELGVSLVLICESTLSDIYNMLSIADKFCCEKDELIERYFMNFNMYF